MTNLIPGFGKFDVRHNPYVTYLEWLSSEDDSHFRREQISSFLIPGYAYERWCALWIHGPGTQESFRNLVVESVNYHIGRRGWLKA